MAKLSKKEQKTVAIGGGALLLFAMMGSKKGKAAKPKGGGGLYNGGGGGGGGGGGEEEEDLTLPGVIPGPVPSGGPPPFGNGCRSPKNGGSFQYDKDYWGTGGEETGARIDGTFKSLGYNLSVNPLGPDNKMLGGDAVANQVTRAFQSHYNAMSRDGLLSNMGGLEVDGQIGPCVITALKHLVDNGVTRSQWASALSNYR
jgi:hypothetical protein